MAFDTEQRVTAPRRVLPTPCQ